MTNEIRRRSVSDVIAEVDRLVRHVERRFDELERRAAEMPNEVGRAWVESLAEHAAGRLHGLKEAQELLRDLDMGVWS